ncbi:hypothetical protein [Chloroflexus sp.]|uniref:hypothetical protein n=1 Tax=Chloroflexus sp. TaxID=1904827 RepID=UPI0026059C93|nr:hypothetical protein [uncultured Chloroflexus sp.]
MNRSRHRPIRLSALRCIAYEISLNGWRILRRTVNDFSLWRLIEYPWAAKALDVRRGDLVVDIGSGTSSFPYMLREDRCYQICYRVLSWEQNPFQMRLSFERLISG